MTDRQSNPVALITGAARRIGAEMAQHFHSNGYDLVLHYNASAEDAEALANALNAQRPGSAVTMQASLGNLPQIQQMAVNAVAWKGRIDVLINNASSFYPTPLESASIDDWNNLMDSNLKGPYFLCQTLAGALRQQRGCIINFADIHARQPLRNHSIYCMAKAGNLMLTKSLAKELGPEVRVNGIAPGAILWPEQEPLDNASQDKILTKIPLARTGTPEEIAALALFLAQGAGYITGHIINMDGGRSLN
jgi:pteridine reductase